MSKFTTDLDIKIIGAQVYEVDSPLVYERENQIIQVNKGFDFDGASVPQMLWGLGLSPMTGGYQRAACLHDALYASECFDRKTCDCIFLEAMTSDGVPYTKRMAMFYAVRMFGSLVWKEHKKDEVDYYKRFITVI
jgi:hypothetical protein